MKQGYLLTKKRLFFYSLTFTLFLFINHNLYSQTYTEYKGSVIDISTKKSIVFADLNIKETNISTITNSEGEFLLKVPTNIENKVIIVSHLGYEKLEILLSSFKDYKMKIALEPSVTELKPVEVKAPKNAKALVQTALKSKGDNYYDKQALMTVFYRETIKKRRKNASLSEAVLEVYKQPYSSSKKDAIKLIKSRKNTNYSRLDTIALKLQGGPFSTLYTDIVKHPRYVFLSNDLSNYDFSFDNFTQINNRRVFVVNFKQRPDVELPLYYGKLFIDAETYALVSAIYNLNVSNKKEASALFIRKKPRKVDVYPLKAAYRVNYRVKNGKWFYGYSNISLTFKVNWKGKLFNSVYTLQSEMAVTDWEENTTGISKPKDHLKPNIIFADEASGFSDPEFWGEFNIIEPEKSIESAIKKIKKQVKRSKP